MATLTTSGIDLFRKNLLMAYKAYDESPQRVYYKDMAGKVLTSDQLFEISAMVDGLILPTIVNEMGIFPQDDIREVANKTSKAQKRGLQVRFSDEVLINDQSGVIKGLGRLIAGVFQQAKEQAAAVYVNGCLSTSLIQTAQGEALSSATHALGTGGTDTNTFTTQQTLGVIALEDATNLLGAQLSYKGIPAPKLGPFQLEVAIRNNQLSKRLLHPGNLPTTNNNDMNAIASSQGDGQISKIIPNPYFTNPEWWCLRSIDADKQARFMIQRYGFKITGMSYDEDVDAWKITGKESYIFDAMDYRGSFYSTPS